MNIIKKPKNKLYPIPKGKIEANGYGYREGSPISLLIHSTNNTGGNTTFASEVKFLYEARHVGCNYLVGADEIVEFLDPIFYFGWHAGNVNNNKFSNYVSISIEVHYSPSDKEQPINSKKLENLTALVKHLIALWNIPKENIEMHRTVAPSRKIDPSFFTNKQFYTWRDSLYEKKEMKEYIVSTDTAQIYTSPEIRTVARHINDGAVVNGIMPRGYRIKGKEVTGQNINGNNKWIWLATHWGFVFSADLSAYSESDILIIGNNNVMVEYLFAALDKYTKLPESEKETIVAAYTALGDVTGIGSLYPFCQGAKETAWFTSERYKNSFNTSGLGADDTGAWGSHFTTITAGVLAQYAHLLCYAVTEDKLNYIQQQLSHLSPRRKEMIQVYGLGAANNKWTGLSQKWNSPKESGKNYGQDIIKMANIITGNN